MRILAETGRVDWNKRDRESETPLYWAQDRGYSDIVDIIVQQPNYNVKTTNRMTVCPAAVEGETTNEGNKTEPEVYALAEKTILLEEVKIGLSPKPSLTFKKMLQQVLKRFLTISHQSNI